jgi:hypothetical protein
VVLGELADPVERVDAGFGRGQGLGIDVGRVEDRPVVEAFFRKRMASE